MGGEREGREKGRGRKGKGVWAPNVHDRLTPLSAAMSMNNCHY